MPNKKITAMPDLAGGQVPTDLATLVDLSALPASQNVKSTLNNLFSIITRNITDGALRFTGVAAPAVSAAGQGSLYFSSASNRFEISQNAGGYVPLAVVTGIIDVNGNEMLTFSATPLAVNELTLANSTTTNPVTLSTTGDDASIGFTITCKGTGITNITGNVLLNSIIGTTGIGVSSAATEQLAITSLSASRVALAVNSLANSTVDLATFSANVDDTATVANLVTLNCNSNGAAAAGFGQSTTYTLESSTTPNRTAALQAVNWKVATDASRSSVLWWSTVDNAVTTERVILAPRLALTDNVATTLFSFTIATNIGAGGIVHATVFAALNGTAVNVWSGDVAYCASSDGTVNRNASILGTPAASGSGTMTVAFAAVNTGNVISIQVTANIDFAPTAGQFFIVFSIEQNHGPVITLA